MKNIIRIVVFLSFLQSGICSQVDKPLAVATASIMADFVENVAGELLEVKTIVPIGGDPHIYEPTPADAQLVYEADIIFVNGLTFEGWIKKLIENSGSKAKVITLTEGLEAIRSQEYQNSTDPHAWMDVSFAKTYAENAYKGCSLIMPTEEKTFNFNKGVYLQQLEDLDKWVYQQIEQIPDAQRLLITSHDAFQYYGRRYGIKLEAILGTSTDAQAQTSDVVRLNKVIKESGVPSVFIETTVNPKLLAQIASDNDVKVGGTLFSDSLGDEKSQASTYIDMIKYNTNTLVNALSKDKEPGPMNEISKKQPNINNYLIGASLFLILALLVVRFIRRKQ